MTGHGRKVSVLGVPTSAGVAQPRAGQRPGRVAGANFPHFAGLTLDEVSAALNEFARGEKFGGLVGTEGNPDPDPRGAPTPAPPHPIRARAGLPAPHPAA